MLENMSIKMRPPAWVTFLLSIDGGLALGFIIPSFVSISALDVLVITFLPLIIAVAVNLFREGELRAPTDKTGRVIGILGLFGFFLGFGIAFGMTRADVLTTTGGEEDVLIIFLRIIFNTDNVTMTHLFLLTVTIFTVAPLLGLANDLRKSARARTRMRAQLMRVRVGGVKGLIQSLKDEDWKVQVRGAWALGELGDTRAVEPLIQTLKDESENVRWQAAWALGRIGDARAVEPLAKTLKDEDSSIRYCAAEALRALPLERIRNESAVAALTSALAHEDYKVRCNAAHALGRIGDKSAVPALIKALRDTHMEYANDEHPDMGKFHPVSVAAADALGAIGDRSAVPALIEALRHSDWFVRESAKKALIAFERRGDGRATEALKKIEAKKS